MPISDIFGAGGAPSSNIFGYNLPAGWSGIANVDMPQGPQGYQGPRTAYDWRQRFAAQNALTPDWLRQQNKLGNFFAQNNVASFPGANPVQAQGQLLSFGPWFNQQNPGYKDWVRATYPNAAPGFDKTVIPDWLATQGQNLADVQAQYQHYAATTNNSLGDVVPDYNAFRQSLFPQYAGGFGGGQFGRWAQSQNINTDALKAFYGDYASTQQWENFLRYKYPNTSRIPRIGLGNTGGDINYSQISPTTIGQGAWDQLVSEYQGLTGQAPPTRAFWDTTENVSGTSNLFAGTAATGPYDANWASAPGSTIPGSTASMLYNYGNPGISQMAMTGDYTPQQLLGLQISDNSATGGPSSVWDPAFGAPTYNGQALTGMTVGDWLQQNQPDIYAQSIRGVNTPA